MSRHNGFIGVRTPARKNSRSVTPILTWFH